MALQSQLFRGDPKLEAAAVSDPAHILQGANGPHVAKIQQALIQLDGAAIDPDGKYGPATARAVSAFKQERQILNFQGKIDDIVGKKTIAALDAGMLAKERNGAGARPRLAFGITGDAIPRDDVTVDPFLFSASKTMTLIALFDDPGNDDLNADDPPRLPLTFAERLVVNNLNAKTPILEAFMRAELFGAAQGLGVEMFDKFKANNVAGAPITFKGNSRLASEVANNSNFVIDAHDKVRLEFDALLKAQFAKGRVNVNALEAKISGKMPGDDNRRTLTNPAGVKTFPIVTIGGVGDLLNPDKRVLPLLAVIGGRFQGGVAAVSAFSVNRTSPPRYEATLVYTLTDHFGVNNSDVIFDGFHGTLGQIAFWNLQHRHHPGHNPFVTTVVIEQKVVGLLR